MSVLWTDVIDPATLTGYARRALADYEAQRGTLARWLPNRTVEDIVVRFFKGQTGLVDTARFRAYDAELEVGRRPDRKRVTLELPALGQIVPVSEYEQLRARGGGTPSEAQALAAITSTTRTVVRATADAIEYLRGVVLATGRATVDQDNFALDDDFGRPSSHQVTAPDLWSDPNADRLGYLETITDVYRESTGEDPGALLMPTRVFRALANGAQFRTVLIDGANRPATVEQVNAMITSAGLPPISRYDRRVSVNGQATRALPDDSLYLLPAPVDPDDWQGTDLGSTIWGRTLSSQEPEWAIDDGEQPGIVTGVYRHQKPPMGIEVIADAVGMPILANAERSLAAKVL